MIFLDLSENFDTWAPYGHLLPVVDTYYDEVGSALRGDTRDTDYGVDDDKYRYYDEQEAGYKVSLDGQVAVIVVEIGIHLNKYRGRK